MPRPPTRRQKAPSKSPRSRVATTLNSSLRVRQHLERKLADKPVGQRPTDSDDSDRLVTRTPNSRARTSSGLHREIYASGGVGAGDQPGSYPTRAQRRRNLENDTRQIIAENRARSRSTNGRSSGSASPGPTKSTLRTAVAADEVGRAQAQGEGSVVEAPQSTGRPSSAKLSRVQRTPLGETSILGTLKPRKRQPSILHMIDHDDSSSINPEDEEQFLPDDESTPLHTKHATETRSSPRSLLSSASSRKRKHGSDQPDRAAHSTTQSPSILASSSRDDNDDSLLPPMPESAAKRPKIQRQSYGRGGRMNEAEDDVMAMPQSSSPEPSPPPPRQRKSPTKSKDRSIVVPSTQQLQSLMPSKRRRGNGDRSDPNHQFDLPEDSLSDPIGVDDGDSAFLPGRRQANRKKGGPGKSNSKARTNTHGVMRKAKASNARIRNQTSTTPALLVPTTPRPASTTYSSSSRKNLRTPLPLTRSMNGENRTLNSPLSQQPRTPRTGPAAATPTAAAHSTTESKGRNSKRNGAHASTVDVSSKQSGGYLPRKAATIVGSNDINTKSRTTRRTRGTAFDEAANDQENSHGKRADVVDMGDFETDGAALQSNSVYSSEYVGRVQNLDDSMHKAASRWKSQWANIDEWSLDYEEVDVSTGSSSPMRR